MSRLPAVTGAELVRALRRAGFAVVRQRGSHVFLRHDDGRSTVVPVHRGEALGAGLLLLEVPRDCSIVGMDDVDAAALVRSGLTTVALDRKERGRLVAEVLLARINGTGPPGPSQKFIQPTLVVRGSTAPPTWQQTGRRTVESVA